MSTKVHSLCSNYQVPKYEVGNAFWVDRIWGCSGTKSDMSQQCYNIAKKDKLLPAIYVQLNIDKALAEGFSEVLWVILNM